MKKDGEKKAPRPGTPGGGRGGDFRYALHSEIVRNMKEGAVLVDARTLKIIYTNPEFDRMMGYRAGELAGKLISRVNAPADKNPADMARDIRDSLLGSGTWRGEIKSRRKDGSPIWCHVSIIPFEHPELGAVYLSIHQDITERRKAEEDVQFRAALLDNTNDGIHVLDTDGGIVYCNETFCRQTGYSRGELLGRNISSLTAGGGPPFARRPEKGAFRHGPPAAQFEVTVRRKDGTTFPVEVFARTAALDGKKLIIAIGRDITGRKRMEAALRDSEANFRHIFDSALDGLLLADARTGRFVMCNKRICAMLGYHERELLRLSVRDIHPAQALAHVREQFDRQVRGEIELAPGLPVQRKDGGVFYADVNSALIEFGGRKCLMGNFRDVTERRRAELALKQSENLHRTLIDTTDTGYVVINDKGLVIDANEKYLSFTGYSGLEEIYGRSVLEWTAEYDLKKNNAAVAECARTGRIRNLEVDYVDRRGRTTPIEINATVVEMEGKPQLLSICRDITNRKRSEEALRDSLKQLAEQKKLLEQKNIAFQEVIRSIELEKTAIKDSVARNVSELVMPILKRLKLNGASRRHLDLLQKNLAALTASFGREITEKARRLTPREIEISNMIKEGLTSKEIAGLIGASSQTVDKHRKNIRRKLGLNARKSNLVSFLRSLQYPPPLYPADPACGL